MRRNGRHLDSALRARLGGRQGEIEAAAQTRVNAISDPTEIADPDYVEGLRLAVRAAISYGIETVGREGADPPIPVALLGQARMAARVGIPLDTVLRRYFAGYSLLGYFVLEEANLAGITDGAELQRLLGAHAGVFDRLVAAVGDEYAQEVERQARATGERRLAERLSRLLACESVDTSEIPYDFGGWHVGVLAAGPDAESAIRGLVKDRDSSLLLVRREEGMLWAWLGARRRPDVPDLLRASVSRSSEDPTGHTSAAIALGEPAEGLVGWRLSHRQAAAALPVAQRGPRPTVRYADVILLAAALRDDLLANSLRRLYIEPLEGDRDRGAVLCKTLRAHLAADRNLTSTAAALGVNRSTVSYRLRTVEERCGRPLPSCMAELEVALDMERLKA